MQMESHDSRTNEQTNVCLSCCFPSFHPSQLSALSVLESIQNPVHLHLSFHLLLLPPSSLITTFYVLQLDRLDRAPFGFVKAAYFEANYSLLFAPTLIPPGTQPFQVGQQLYLASI